MSTFSKYQLSWLTDRSDELMIDACASIADPIDMKIPKKFGAGGMITEHLTNGMSVCHVTYQATPAASGILIPITKFEYTYPETTLAIQTVYGGQFVNKELTPKKEVIFGSGRTLFRHTDHVKLTAYLDGSSDSEMIAVQIADSSLKLLLGEEVLSDLLLYLGIHKTPSIEVTAIPNEISKILLPIVGNQLKGAARRLYAQSKILEYIGALLERFSSSPSNQEQYQANLADKVKNYLISVDGRMPSLDDIAKEFDAPAQSLNLIFSKRYKESIYSFLRNYRLMQAHEALNNSDVPMKLVAWNLGYSHVNHFITAFKNKFGYPPGTLRKKVGKAGAR